MRESGKPEENVVTEGQTINLKPLRASGVVVAKADLIEALQVYVPGLVDLQVTEDGGHFWLLLGEDGRGDMPAQ